MRLALAPARLLNRRGAARRLARQASSKPAAAAGPDVAADPDVAAQLKKAIQLLYVAHVAPHGVDYAAMKASPEFAAYVAQAARLAELDLAQAVPDDARKIAFFVNLYNALTLHGIIQVGTPQGSSVFRLLFAMAVGYCVDNFKLSLNDIENGILRGNRGVSILPRPFGKNDPRKALCVREVDPRIHFVLNCGANSCPPVLFLTPDNLDRALDMATRGFLSSEDNLSVQGDTVALSQIFNWYMDDFADGKGVRGLLEWVGKHGGQEQEQVKEVNRILRETEGDLSIEWKVYDWKLNSV